MRGQRGAEVPGIGGVESVVRSIQSPDDLRARDAVLHETETRLALPDRALCLRQVVVVLDPRRAVDPMMRDVESLKNQAGLQQVHRLA